MRKFSLAIISGGAFLFFLFIAWSCQPNYRPKTHGSPSPVDTVDTRVGTRPVIWLDPGQRLTDVTGSSSVRFLLRTRPLKNDETPINHGFVLITTSSRGFFVETRVIIRERR